MAWVSERPDVGPRMATVLLLLICLAATLLRFYRLTTWQHFLGDEGREMFAAEGIVTGGMLPLVGPPLAGYTQHLGPIFYYLIAPALWVTHAQPIGPATLIAICGVATVLLIYRYCHDFLESRLAGLVAAAGYATSQVAVYHGRYVWNPNMAPLFVMAVLYCLCAVIRGRQRFLPWLGLTLSVATQLQPVLIIALPAVVVIWLLYRPQVRNLRLYLLALVLFLAVETPLLIFEWRTDFRNTHGWIDTLLGRVHAHTPAPPVTGGPGGRLLHSLNRGGHELWQFFYRMMGLDPQQYLLVLIALLVGGLSVLIVAALRDRREASGVAAGVLILWTGAFFVGFGFYPGQLYEQYFVALFPLPFLMLGFAAHRLWWSGWGILGRLAVLAAVFALAGVNINGLWSTHFGLKTYQMDADQFGGMQAAGMTIADMQQVVDTIARTTAGRPFNLVLAATDDHDMGYRYLLHLKGLTPSRAFPSPVPLAGIRDSAIAYPGEVRNAFIIIQPKWWPPNQWPGWIHVMTVDPTNKVHPDVEFSYVLLRYVEQTWAADHASPKYNVLPCDETDNSNPAPPTYCDPLNPPPA